MSAAVAQGSKFARADKAQLATLFGYLEGCLEQIVKDNELGALKQALKVGSMGVVWAWWVCPFGMSG